MNRHRSAVAGNSLRLSEANAGVYLAVLMVVSAALGGSTPSAALAADPGATEKLVLAEGLGNAPGLKLTAVLVTYTPGASSSKHHHAGSVFAYIVSGSIRSQNSVTGPVKVYRAGESFFEPSGSVHLVSENASATQPASLLAVFVAPEGATLTAPQ